MSDPLTKLRAECERALELDAGIETHSKRASRALLRAADILEAAPHGEKCGSWARARDYGSGIYGCDYGEGVCDCWKQQCAAIAAEFAGEEGK